MKYAEDEAVLELMSERLFSWLMQHACGRAHAKTKDKVIEGLFQEYGIRYLWRVLCKARVWGLSKGRPIAPCNDGWFVPMHLRELVEVRNVETSRGISVLCGLRDLEKAFFSYHSPMGKPEQTYESLIAEQTMEALRLVQQSIEITGGHECKPT